MNRGLFSFGLILLLLGGGLFAGVNFEVERTIEVEVPYTEQVPYEVEVEYTEQEPYEEIVSYQEDVIVSRSNYLIKKDETFTQMWYVFNTFQLEEERQINIMWSSDQNVFFFAILSPNLFSSFSTITGLSTSGGTLGPYGAIIGAVAGTLLSLIETVDYGKMNTNGDSFAKTFSSGTYNLVVIILNVPNKLDIDIFYEYDTLETQTLYRTETKYRTITKTRTETRYTLVEKKRIETQIIKKPLISLPTIEGVSWNAISIGIILIGMIFAGLSLRK